MENTDSYLHKKFKKQLSVPTKLQNDKENKDAARSHQSEEKAYNHATPKETRSDEENAIVYRLPCESAVGPSQLDNNNIVPKQSTNSPSFTVNTNYSKSSISVETQVANQQSSNSYISYVVSNQSDHRPASFDTKFSEQTNNYTVSLSSILDNVYPRPSYANADDAFAHYSSLGEEYRPRLNSCDDASEPKLEEVQRPPDKNASGKYVCHYCNLVCSKPSVLQKHIRAHTNERPYPCESCGFSFKTRSNLYKHCRSRTHANRVMGNKTQETGDEKSPNDSPESREEQATAQKPYKPRFHSGKAFFDNVSKENFEEDQQVQNGQNPTSELLSLHISEIINKNNAIVHPNDTQAKKHPGENPAAEFRYGKSEPVHVEHKPAAEEPLNLTNKNRKRAMSEVSEPVTQKSLIKELLLKTLSSSDMQCPYCKMIFQTVTELDVHKYRSCKGKPSSAKYSRSSSVNVASILTHNKNAFDNIPQLQNTVFPLHSPGPFLGNTRLVDTDKSKSFSFDTGNLPLLSPSESSPSYLLSPLPFDKEKKPVIKLFGGEVKVHSSGETKSFKIDNKEDKFEAEVKYSDYGGKLSENRVVQSGLQSGGTVLTNQAGYSKHDLNTPQVFSGTPSPSMDGFKRTRFTFDALEMIPDNGQEGFREQPDTPKSYKEEPSPLYKNMMDFSHSALRKLTPNLRQPSFTMAVPNSPLYNNFSGETLENLRLASPQPKLIELPRSPRPLPDSRKAFYEPKPVNPVNLLVNGKVVRHVPGMPGPVVAPEPPVDMAYRSNIVAVVRPMQQNLAPLSPLVLQPTKPSYSPVQKEKTIEREKVVEREKIFLQPEKIAERPSRSPNNVSAAERIRTTNALLQVKRTFDFEAAKESPKADISEAKLSPIPNAKPSPSANAKSSESKPFESRPVDGELKRFARPNSLALKPTVASLKQHHGLTPTMFNQILISPDTPRVAKKYAEHFLHGNYFSYLGLKSSTKPVYCTLNKTQPFYVNYFKKLSMYSEWRQQDTKQEKLYAVNYDSRQKSARYTVAGRITANLMTHSSYKFKISESSSSNPEKGDEPQKNTAVLGGYECNEDYTYIRGRGRGRYVCDQCGIRCKKPSMLKKHIRTHSNDRPYTCSHCNFSFKTKGNLTKHMKSKAHSKNSTASSGSSSSTQQSVHSSDSDTDDSGMDSSDESTTRQQEHEAAYGLLSLSQKPAHASSAHCDSDLAHLRSASPNELLMTPEEIAHVSKTNYAKNKILDERNAIGYRSRRLDEMPNVGEEKVSRNHLGTSCVTRPLTYPYTSAMPPENDRSPSPRPSERDSDSSSVSPEPKSIKQFHVIQRYLPNCQLSPKLPETAAAAVKTAAPPPRKTESCYPTSDTVALNNKKVVLNRPLPTLKINDVIITTESIGELRKRKLSTDAAYKNKVQRNDEVMDLSMTTAQDKIVNSTEERVFNNVKPAEMQKNVANEIYNALQKAVPASPNRIEADDDKEGNFERKAAETPNNNGTVIILRPLQTEELVNVSSYASEQHTNSDDQGKVSDYDNSAMETLADVATKQVKLEKNTLAKSVASEFLKLATKNDSTDGGREGANYGPPFNKDVNDIIVKSEGEKSCTICAKSFNKPSQLRLHMNIHYLERRFRCDSCSVSFRTKGHLQKHERSASHRNKLSSSPALSSSEPRPFKCSDCNIAFRIHGHLAKHLRSKMHIMKLECLAKIPFGLYAELERSNSLLTEINTCDGDQCLESLKILARKVFINDPNKLNHLELRDNVIAD